MLSCRHEAAGDVLLCFWQFPHPPFGVPAGTATRGGCRQGHRVPSPLHDGLVPHAVELWPAALGKKYAGKPARYIHIFLCHDPCFYRLPSSISQFAAFLSAFFLSFAGIQTRKARSAAAANIKGIKGALVTIQVTTRRQWSRLKRSIGSVSSLSFTPLT